MIASLNVKPKDYFYQILLDCCDIFNWDFYGLNNEGIKKDPFLSFKRLETLFYSISYLKLISHMTNYKWFHNERYGILKSWSCGVQKNW